MCLTSLEISVAVKTRSHVKYASNWIKCVSARMRSEAHASGGSGIPPPDSALGRGGNQLKTHYVDHKNKEITSLKISLETVPPSIFKFPLLLYNLLG